MASRYILVISLFFIVLTLGNLNVNGANVVCSLFERHVVIGSFGDLTIKDTYNLLGVGREESCIISLPGVSDNIRCFDEGGEIDFEVSHGNNTIPTNVTVTYRYPIQKGWRYKFTVSYNVPSSLYISEEEGVKVLRVPSSTGILDLNITSTVIIVTLPEGAELVSCSPNYSRIWNSWGKTILQIPVSSGETVVIRFHYNMWSSILKPAFAAVILFGAIFGLWFYTKRRRPAMEAVTAAIPIDDFIRMYDEWISLKVRLMKLDEDFASKRVKKRAYEAQKEAFQSRLESLKDKLALLGKELMNADPRFSSYLDRLKALEAELDIEEAGVRMLHRRFVRKQVSSARYNKMLADRRKRIEKIYSQMDEILFSLKSLQR